MMDYCTSCKWQGADLAEQEIARLRSELADMTDDRNEYLMFWRRHRSQLEDMAEADQRLPEKEQQG